MAQIIPQFDMGEKIGRDIKQGLERGLHALANYKLNDVMRRSQLKEEGDALEKMGLDRNIAYMGQSKIPYIQNLFMSRPDLFRQQKPEEKMLNDLSSGMQPQMQEMGGQGPDYTQLMTKLNEALMPQRQGPSNAMDTMQNALRGAIGMGMPQMGEGTKQLMAMNQARQAPMAQAVRAQVPEAQVPQTQVQPEMQQGYRTPRTRAEAVRAEIEMDKANRRALERSSERSEKRVGELQAMNKGIKNNLDAYKQLLSYSRSGEPISGPVAALLTRFGLQDIITNEATQATNKIASSTIINNLSSIKGVGRGTNLLTNTISKANPNIFLTPLGMEAVVTPLRIKDEYDLALNNAIIKERARYDEMGRKPPIDLEARVEDQLEPLAKKKDRELIDLSRRIINSSGGPHQVVEYGMAKRPDPTTYNTAKDGNYYVDEATGEKRGSDGKKDVKVEERNGRMMPVR